MTGHRGSEGKRCPRDTEERLFPLVKIRLRWCEVSEGGKVVEYREGGEDLQELDHKHTHGHTHTRTYAGLYSLLELDDCLCIFETDSTTSH